MITTAPDLPITSIEEIVTQAKNGRAVYVKRWRRRTPASFLVNWQAWLLHQWVVRGEFFTLKRIDA